MVKVAGLLLNSRLMQWIRVSGVHQELAAMQGHDHPLLLLQKVETCYTLNSIGSLKRTLQYY